MILTKLCGLLDVCSGEPVWEQHAARAKFMRTQTDMRGWTLAYTYAHTNTQSHSTKNPKGTGEDSHTLFFACVRMSQGGDEHIQRDATENSNFLGQKTKVYADGKSILPNNEFKFEICSF